MSPTEIKKEISLKEIKKSFINAMLDMRLLKLVDNKDIWLQLSDVSIMFVVNEKHENFACVTNGQAVLWSPSLTGICGFVEKYSEEELVKCLDAFDAELKAYQLESQPQPVSYEPKKYLMDFADDL